MAHVHDGTADGPPEPSGSSHHPDDPPRDPRDELEPINVDQILAMHHHIAFAASRENTPRPESSTPTLPANSVSREQKNQRPDTTDYSPNDSHLALALGEQAPRPELSGEERHQTNSDAVNAARAHMSKAIVAASIAASFTRDSLQSDSASVAHLNTRRAEWHSSLATKDGTKDGSLVTKAATAPNTREQELTEIGRTNRLELQRAAAYAAHSRPPQPLQQDAAPRQLPPIVMKPTDEPSLSAVFDSILWLSYHCIIVIITGV